MRDEEKHKLEKAYPQGDTRPLDDRFADALDVGLRTLRELRTAVVADFDTKKHGVGWWDGHIDLKHRVLVGDQLNECAQSVETNLVEAKLHSLELLDWRDKSAAFLRTGTVSSGPPFFAHPARLRPADELAGHMVELHIAGVVRAVGSALDCLAAVIIGVVALPTPILTADFDRVAERLRKLPSPGSSDGERLQAEFVRAFDAALGSAGPSGWDRWALSLRNMLVHRGRRTGTALLMPRTALLDASGDPIVRPEDIRLLPAEPDLSEIESWERITTTPAFLSESAETTIRQLLGSATKLVSDLSEALVKVWRTRRAAPALLPQPEGQWKNAPRRVCNFVGYDAGRVKLDFDMVIGNPALTRRLQVAALDTGSRHKWK